MPRKTLPEDRIHPEIREKIATRHQDIVAEVEAAIADNRTVVVGMSVNPSCKKAWKTLEQRGLPYRYLQYGGYHSEWRRRTALKMWTGWPTFPMVFHDGVLIGGAEDLERFLDSTEASK